MSSFCIGAIASDRFRFIVQSHRKQMTANQVSYLVQGGGRRWQFIFANVPRRLLKACAYLSAFVGRKRGIKKKWMFPRDMTRDPALFDGIWTGDLEDMRSRSQKCTYADVLYVLGDYLALLLRKNKCRKSRKTITLPMSFHEKENSCRTYMHVYA